ncbi:MAG: sel1 repeat family protein [Chromatiaceae bacterium]|nr:MAG: sel1 repeat family protein [Chromatiaceae bacterium]
MFEHTRWWPAGVALLFCLTTVAALVSASDAARGTVVAIAEGQVGLELAGGTFSFGSAVEILYATPDGDEISYGLWCIDNVRESLRTATGADRLWAISARPAEARAEATVGLAARVIVLEDDAHLQWLERASSSGCRGAQMRLAKHYQHGWGVVQDWDRAFELVRAAAQKDHFDARRELAGMLDSRAMMLEGAEKQAAWREAFEVYLALAEDGFAPSYRLVGHRYLIGQGTQVDLAAAERWYRLAAEHREFPDQEPLTDLAGTLGAVYRQQERANQLLRESARAGGARARAELSSRGIGW